MTEAAHQVGAKVLLHYLRIAVTALCLTACVLLVALWARSYWWMDIATLGLSSGPGYMFGSMNGEVSAAKFPSREGAVSLGWHAWSNPAGGRRAWSTSDSSEFAGFRYGTFFAAMPHWLAILLMSLLGGVPWIRWRFSVRILLIATTLVAVGLGMVVAMS
jgi:hypothetical protein